ncbi:hypothetical protein VT06_03090 [Arsukibacterium sp. MJ3]|jgi:hypothetical protein|uniref:hypothetical protein n=1 Tax=Arsukibacterium sp. MJ3 TaxID=1632859 RepID=UPI00062732B3|nr:hypothetical protein [Arsukibacterium sp. MJ3]KKO49989.1 hypothetical protein VT06_03090 [Arsukibacterium sp. MJ3]
MNKRLKLILYLGLTGLFAANALAHKFSTAYMDVKSLQGQPVMVWKVALHDLAQARLIASKDNHQVTWQQVLDSAPTLNAYLTEQITFSSDGKSCQITPAAAADWQLQRLQRDLYLLLPLSVSCNSSNNWQLTYQALFASEPSHKLLLSWQVPTASANAVLSAESIVFPIQ